MAASMASLLRTRFPIIAAPMAGVTDVDMVVASSRAGILGSIGIGISGPRETERCISQLRERLGNLPFNVNLFLLDREETSAAQVSAAVSAVNRGRRALGLPAMAPPVDDTIVRESTAASINAALQLAPPVVSFTFGLPSQDLVSAFKSAGSVVIGTATTAAEAVLLQANGVDAVCAQGFEAGGHRGSFLTNSQGTGTLALVPMCVDALRGSVPVIAAGGISDGRGIAAAFALGASAVQMGTAFLVAKESPLPASFKAHLLQVDSDGTTLTMAYSGKLARGVANDFTRAMEPSAPTLPYGLQMRLVSDFKADVNHPERAQIWSGQGVPLTRNYFDKTIQEIVDILVDSTCSVQRDCAAAINSQFRDDKEA